MRLSAILFLWLLCLLVLPKPTWAQAPKLFVHQARFSPVALLDLNTPVIQVGWQTIFKSKIGLSAEIGLPFDILEHSGNKKVVTFKKGNRYHKIRGEFKYFLKPTALDKNNYLVPYLGLETFSVWQQYRKEDDWIFRKDASSFYDYSDVTKNVLGSCLKFGLEINLGSRFVIDSFGGLGVRQLTVKHKTTGERNEFYYPGPLSFIPAAIDQKDGTFYRPHLAACLKLGYKLF